MSRSKQIGTRWETELVTWLRENGHPVVERRALTGNRDKGDVAGLAGWTVEAKSARQMRLGDWLDELRVEMRNAKTALGAVAIKRRGKGAAGAYWLVPAEVLLALLPQRGDG